MDAQADSERWSRYLATGRAMKSFGLRYELVRTGWARATLTEAGVETVVTASHLSDALRGLLEATASITEGALEARCVWLEEPGEYRWLFRRNANGVRLEIRSFPKMYDTSGDERGEVIFRTTGLVTQIARTRASVDRSPRRGVLARSIRGTVGGAFVPGGSSRKTSARIPGERNSRRPEERLTEDMPRTRNRSCAMIAFLR
jgi:hypothetical protein